MTAFAAARIAKAPSTMTGWESVKIAKALYILLFMFAFGSLISSPPLEILFDTIYLAVVFAIMPMVFEGYRHRALTVLEHCLLAITAFVWLKAAVGSAADDFAWKIAAVVLIVIWALALRRGNVTSAPGV